MKPTTPPSPKPDLAQDQVATSQLPLHNQAAKRLVASALGLFVLPLAIATPLQASADTLALVQTVGFVPWAVRALFILKNLGFSRK